MTENIKENRKATEPSFRNRREEREYRLKTAFDMEKEELMPMETNILFERLLDAFMADKRVRLRRTTYVSYQAIVERFLRPAFSGKRIEEITTADVRRWQNCIMKLDYKPQYVRKIDSMLTTVLNFGMRFYGLKKNVALAAGSIGEWKSRGNQFWTCDEYARFRRTLTEGGDRPPKGGAIRNVLYPVAFDLLFWTGMRVGELLALTPSDFDFDAGTVTISKSFHHIESEDYIDLPKTRKSNRTIAVHKALLNEVDEAIKKGHFNSEERIFAFTRNALEYKIDRVTAAIGMEPIKLHSLRHSHASLLVEMGVSPLLIAERLGHEKVETTLNIYSHLYPNKQAELVADLEKLDIGGTGD